MDSRRAWFVVLALLLAASPSAAQEPDATVVERLIDLGKNDSRVMEHLDVLCNQVGPRLTGSTNLQRALELMRDRFEEFGLEDARLEEWGEFPVGFDRGPSHGKVLAPEPLDLVCGTPAWMPGTNGSVQGPALLAPRDPDELEQARQQLARAWVLNRSPELPSAEERRAFMEQRSAAYREAGVLGVISSARSDLLTTFGQHRIEWDDLPDTVAITVIKSQFEQIQGWLEEGRDVLLEFSIDNSFLQGPIRQYNVIADLPGRELPGQYVIVGGHLDSWDGASGCTDNGTGASTTVEAARLLVLAGAAPRRTIRFILWTGEEQGLFGSRGHVRDHKAEMESISAVFVHDGGTNYVSGIRHTPAMKQAFEQVFEPVRKLSEEMPFELREVEGLRSGSSDHDSYLAEGVPAFFWDQDGRAVYRETWHTHKDHYEAAIPEYQAHSALVIALAAYGTANLDDLFSRENLRAPRRSRRMMGIQLGEDGTTVSSVVEESLAAQAGWQEGDRILQVDDTKIAGMSDLRRALQEGEPVKIIQLKRGEETLRFRFDWQENKATPVEDAR